MRYRINDFVLDAERFEFSHQDEPLKAEPQVIELLILLIENRQRMVSKEEINERIWHGRIVSEAALSSRIKSLRQLLGDSGRQQKIIRTIHKKGFRLVAEVESLEYAARSANLPASTNATDAPPQQQQPTIAVLPFANPSNDQEQEYFSDGVTSDIFFSLQVATTSKHNSAFCNVSNWISILVMPTPGGHMRWCWE